MLLFSFLLGYPFLFMIILSLFDCWPLKNLTHIA